MISRKIKKIIKKYPSGGGDGAEVIYALRNSDALSKKIAAEIENSGQNVRKYYQRRLPSDPSKDYYYILRDTPNTQALIVEYGFLDSTGDDVEQLKNNWEKYAEAVVKALADYIGVPYTNQNAGTYYVVKSGDSLWSIANKYGTTVAKLKELNNLTSNSLNVGQTLLVKEIPTSDDANYYIVKSGDTLYGIARKYNMTVDEIKRLNNLTSNALTINQRLLIKKDNNTGETIPSTPTSNYNTYTVVKGDSLWSISKKFNTTVDNLININNLKSNNLSIGQKLLVPKQTGLKTYTVKSGDNLYAIARTYGTTVTDLINLNNLKSTTLSIGQVLQIP